MTAGIEIVGALAFLMFGSDQKQSWAKDFNDNHLLKMPKGKLDIRC